MPEKCSVVGCKSLNLNVPNSRRFRFPPASHHEIRAKWIFFQFDQIMKSLLIRGFVLISLMLNT